MQVVVEEVSSVVKHLTIDLEAERVSAAITKAVKAVSAQVSLPGFRAGKAPLSMIEKRFWHEIEHRVVESMVEAAVTDAIKENKLAAVATKDFKPGELVKGSGYKFSVDIEVAPEFEAANYCGLKAQKPWVKVSDEEVNKSLESIRNAHKNMVVVTDHNKVVNGDIVVGDLHITDGDKVITDQFGIRIDVGESRLFPNSDAVLLDREVPSKMDEIVEYPADFENKLLAGKKAKVEFELKEIKKEELPELDDDLAAAAGYDNFAAMKAHVEEEIKDKATKDAEKALEESVGSALIAAHKFDVPNSMVRERATAQVRQMLEQFAAYMPNIQQNLTMEMVEGMIERNMPGAERDVRLNLIMSKIATKENITVSDDDVAAELKRIAEASNQSVEQIRGYFEKNKAMDGLKISIARKKTMDFLVSKAEVEEVDPASLKKEDEAEHKHEHGEDCDCCH